MRIFSYQAPILNGTVPLLVLQAIQRLRAPIVVQVRRASATPMPLSRRIVCELSGRHRGRQQEDELL